MAFYTPLLAHNGYDIVMLKATSSPTTDGNWSEQDGSVRVETGGGRIGSLWSFEHSSDIYVATQQEFDGRVKLHIFDPGTDTWTTKNEYVAVIDDSTDFDEAPDLAGCSIAVRSDGDIVIAFTVNDATIGEDDVLCRSRVGSTWGSIQKIVNDGQNPITIGPDSSDRITFIWKERVADDLFTRSISSSDVLGTVVVLDDAIDTAGLVIGPGIIDSGNEIYVPFIDGSNKISVKQFTSAADPTGDITDHDDVSDNTVEGNGRSAPPFVVACLAVDRIDVYLVYADDSSQDMFFDTDVKEGGGKDIEIEDAVTCNRISMNKLATTLGIVWLDGTTVKYKEIPSGVIFTALSQADMVQDELSYYGPFEVV